MTRSKEAGCPAVAGGGIPPSPSPFPALGRDRRRGPFKEEGAWAGRRWVAVLLPVPLSRGVICRLLAHRIARWLPGDGRSSVAAAAAAAMLWLGQPCALHALLPKGLFQAASGSAALREAATSRLQAAGASRAGDAAAAALGLLLSGQVQLSPAAAAEKEAPRRKHPWRSHRLLHRCLSRESLLPSPVRCWFPALAEAADDPRRSQGERLLLLLLLGPREAADPRQLRSEITLQATESPFPAGGGGGGSGGRDSSLGSRKDTSGSPQNDPTDPSQENGKKPNKSQQLKKVFKEYGAVGVAFHVGISLMSLGMFYLAVSSGVDMTVILFKLGFDEALVQSKLAAGTSTFVLAYAIHKLFAPVRISITLVSVPLLVQYFRKIGFFKPPAQSP